MPSDERWLNRWAERWPRKPGRYHTSRKPTHNHDARRNAGLRLGRHDVFAAPNERSVLPAYLELLPNVRSDAQFGRARDALDPSLVPNTVSLAEED